MRSSADGGTVACVPTAPLILPTLIEAVAAVRRARPRRTSSTQRVSIRPKVIGSAWMPCVRPTISVRLCSRAFATRTASSRAISACNSAAASRSCSDVAVSQTSDEVSPRCTQRASSPRESETERRKAVTSWWVSA